MNWNKNYGSYGRADFTASMDNFNGQNVERFFNLIHKT